MNRETAYNFIIDEDNQSTRIDSVLSLLLPDTSRSFIQKLIEGGNLTVNGKSCTKKKYLTTAGDRVELRVPEPEQLKIEAENIPLEIIFEDEDVLVVNKPKGMVVHPAVGNYTGTLVNAGGNYVNAYTGETTAFGADGGCDVSLRRSAIVD